MASRAEMIAAAKAAQGVVQAAPTVAAALAPPPPPAPATAPAPAVPAPRRETAPREHHRREAALPPPPPPAPKVEAPAPTPATPVWQPPVTAFHGVLKPEAYINPEDTMRRVDEMRMQRLQRASQAATRSRGERGGFPSSVEDFMPPRGAAPESALQSVDAYRTELDRRGRQYQQLGEMLAKLGETRRELEELRRKEGTAPLLHTVKRPLTDTEQRLEQVQRATSGFSQDLQRMREGLKEMGLTEEQIKLYD